MKIKKIGVFDSGLGGVSIVQELLAVSGLEIVYFADTANVPYGNKSKEEIQALSYAAIRFLLQHNVDAIVIACHTVATNALQFLHEQFPNIFFINVVDLILEQITVNTTRKKIGILGTNATIASNVHEKRLQEKFCDVTIFCQACPRLASAIEYEFNNSKQLSQLVKDYTENLRNHHVEIILLACTHYALIQELIQSVFEYDVTIISAEHAIKKWLEPYIDLSSEKTTTFIYFSTGKNRQFGINIEQFIKQPIIFT